ncbi:flagellar biosynthetic protein FliQ [Scopulibacillus darangshiensis]|uniref:Flagellar biosynthetic protein FliQ n=1 Tax=Scopulibacillus darangshiensis TaxID=442528 RepID=A0A4V2SN86_9BACL|nr:flagellar biosynthesis protein FliQ [Scopulibacillus darangshiensis]TCP30316.1 flagellar biosynthetic protein FliQ [Scopulibacillus darangshiensis]
MNSEMILSIAEKGVMTTLIVSGPLLAIALIVGLVVSIFQATTQIQEQTLAFIPKIAAVLFALILFGPWMLSKMLAFTQDIFANLNHFVG